MDQTLPNSKADKRLAALAQSEAAQALLNAKSYALVNAIAPITSGEIPNPTSANGVVLVFAAITPKFSGKLRVLAGVVTTPNVNGGAQAVRLSLASTLTLPSVGSTVLPFSGLPGVDSTAASGASASSTDAELFVSPIGTTVYICACLSQSVASAFSIAAPSSATWISVEEVP